MGCYGISHAYRKQYSGRCDAYRGLLVCAQRPSTISKLPLTAGMAYLYLATMCGTQLCSQELCYRLVSLNGEDASLVNGDGLAASSISCHLRIFRGRPNHCVSLCHGLKR